MDDVEDDDGKEDKEGVKKGKDVLLLGGRCGGGGQLTPLSELFSIWSITLWEDYCN
jgi:hypothetical protein